MVDPRARSFELPAELHGANAALVDFALASPTTPVLLLDGGGVVEEASPAALADLDVAPDTVRGMPIDALLGIALTALPHDGSTISGATSADGRDLTWRAVHLADARADGGWLLEFECDGAGPDRTARLERILVDLTDRHERLDRYTGLISHDLQAPTRRLLSFVDLLRGDLADPSPTVTDGLDAVERSARYLLLLTSELLQFSRLGTQPMPLAPVDAQTCLDITLEQLAGELSAADATVEVRGPMPVVDASSTFLSVVFQHLVQNALTYRRDDPPRIVITAEAADGWVRLSVADNGIGIAPGLRDAAFQPARRLVAGDLEHTGLGLATVREIVQRFGGTVEIESSEPGVGTTFVVTLRAHLPPDPGGASPVRG